MDEKIKVIHFFKSEYLKDCIDLGYLGDENEWNPSREIMLYPCSKLEELKEEGIRFEGVPNQDQDTGGEENTFLRSPDDSSLFIQSNNYADSVIATKEGAIIEVLQNLGIHEYYIHTLIKGEVGIGKHKETKVNADGNANVKGIEVGSEGNYQGDENRRTGVNAKYFNVSEYIFNNKEFVLNEKSWKKAVKIAKQYGLDKNKKVANMLTLRKPGTNNELTSSYTRIDFTGDIKANFDIAKSLRMLAKVPGIASIAGGISKLFSFEAEAQLQYKTLVIYNFNKEPAIEKIKQQIKESGEEI